MNDYSELCIALQKQLRMVFESANEKKYDKAIKEAQFLDALSGLLVQELRKKQGK
jgi:hypothetical protein